MKLSGRTAGFTLLAVAYVVSCVLALRHFSKSEDPRRVTIRIAQWQLESGVREAVDAIIKRYEQINPRVHVVQIAVPGGPIYTSWVMTQMAGGNGPDLVQYDPSDPGIARFFQPISADVMQPNPYNRGTPLEGVKWRDTFIDGMTTTGFDVNLHDYYSASMDTHMARIVYNQTLMNTITGSDAPPRTYRDLLRLCDLVRAYAGQHRLKLVPMANSKESVQLQCWLITMALTDGLSERIDHQHRLSIGPGDLGRDYLVNDWSFDTPEAVASLKEVKEFGDMCTTGFWARERDEAVTDFVSERALMIVAPSYEATNLLALCRFPIAAFRYPYPLADDPEFGRIAHGPFSEGQIVTGMPIYLNRATKHRAEAIDFLKFMTSQEGSTIFTQVSNWPPATVGVKPSHFASQFKLVTDGYSWGGNLLVPTIEGNASNFIFTTMAELWDADGSVDNYRKIMRENLAEKIRADLRREDISVLDNIRRLDIEAVARMEQEPPARRSGVLPLFAASNEGLLYQNLDILASEPGSSRSRQDETVEMPAPARGGAAGATATSPDPSVTAGWQTLLSEGAEKAIAVFNRKADDPDPEVTRAALFGRGVSLLDKQPVSRGSIEEARRIFAALSDTGADDAAQGARFFLGRIAQDHLETPEPAEAAREYVRLISEHPRSLWAQTALPRLAMLLIYALDGQSPPQARIARAGKLLAFANDAKAACDLNFVIANATLFYRLPPASALPHLIAAEQSGRLDWIDRREALVQIAELSRLGGDNSQAARFYRTFLSENPIDFRRYIVSHRLADTEKRQADLAKGP